MPRKKDAEVNFPDYDWAPIKTESVSMVSSGNGTNLINDPLIDSEPHVECRTTVTGLVLSELKFRTRVTFHCTLMMVLFLNSHQIVTELDLMTFSAVVSNESTNITT